MIRPTLKHACDLTDVLATCRFTLLVKSLQWNRNILCRSYWRQMFTLFEPFSAAYVKRARLFQPHFLKWMRGSRVKLKDLKKAQNDLLRQNNRKQMKQQLLNRTYKAKKLANMLQEAHTSCLKQACFWKLVIIQLQIKILSEGFMMINFISKSSEFIQLLICKKIARVIFVWTKWEE